LWRNFGEDWIHIDGGDYDHLKYDNITKLEFKDNTVDVIYASHVFEYFDYEEAKVLLAEWRRVLKVDGVIRLAVPDFDAMSGLYQSGEVLLKDIVGPLYGKMPMGDTTIYHKTTYDFETMKEILEECGFKDIRRYDWKSYPVHVDNDDHSQAYLSPKGDKEKGTLISLNIKCKKK